MPLYTIHVSRKSIASFTSFAKALAELHGETFNTDPLAVRVMRSRDSEDLDYYGGYGYKPRKGPIRAVTTDYIVAQVDFRGSPEVWQEFCKKVTALYGVNPPLTSIYLQKLEYEFEAGGLISAND